MWISAEDASAMWCGIVGGSDVFPSMTMSAETIRRRCRDGDMQAAGIDVDIRPGRYYLDREALLRHIIAHCDDVGERARKEMES